MSNLHVAPGLRLPLDAATESFGILGQRGSGKSNVEVVFAEELWKNRVPWVAIDPKGDWHGIRKLGLVESGIRRVPDSFMQAVA